MHPLALLSDRPTFAYRSQSMHLSPISYNVKAFHNLYTLNQMHAEPVALVIELRLKY